MAYAEPLVGKNAMKLQVALDGPIDHSLAILQVIHPYIDIAEIGTPLIYREGIGAALRVRQAFPDLTLLADLKIMDAGEDEAIIAFTAGCDIVTVLGLAADVTVRGVLAAAQDFSRQMMVDMIQVPDLEVRSRELLEMGCHLLCVHTAYDLQTDDSTPLDDLRCLRRSLPGAPFAVAGGIGMNTIDEVVKLAPKVVVVGAAITGASDPAQVAQAIRRRINSNGAIS